MQLSSQVFEDLLDSIIVDVASECHRIARLGLDRNLEEEEEEFRLSAQARVADPSSSSDGNSKSMVDIFGQTHPAIAGEIFDCMNCGRPIVAGRFAPHLEKCMGKVGSFSLFCHWISMNLRYSSVQSTQYGYYSAYYASSCNILSNEGSFSFPSLFC